MSDAPTANPPHPPSFWGLAAHMLLLGCTAFGGPAAHIAMMRREFVQRRAYLSEQEFVDMLGVVNLLPGPNSSEMAMHIGHKIHGLRGMVVCGLSFIMPAILLMTAAAAIITSQATANSAAGALSGVLAALRPVVCALVAVVALQLLSTPDMRRAPAIFGIAIAVALLFTGLGEAATILAAGGIVAILRALDVLPRVRETVADSDAPVASVRETNWTQAALIGIVTTSVIALVTFAEYALRQPAMEGATPSGIFQYFLRIGSVLYGSGYVLLSYIDTDLVARFHWLTSEQLLNAVAIGQAMPGPLFATAAFIGYQLAGISGAAAAAAGIFAPAFVFVGFAGNLAQWLRRSPATSAFLEAVNAAAIVLLVIVAVRLGHATLIQPLPIVLFLVALPLFWSRINSVYVIVAAALFGWVFLG